MVISYATEANLFIKDLNQSPFNVGRRIELEDFTLTQLIDLNRRYRAPLRSANEVEQLQACIAGQPFLARRALDLLVTGQYHLSTLLTQADRDDGPFGDHLKRLLVSLSRLPAVLAYLRSLLTGAAPNDEESYFRLLAAGVIRHTSSGEIVFRCTLYQRYLTQHLKP